MSQEQPRRPQTEPIKYGDVFPVTGNVASQPIAPRDAAAVQSAEQQILGHIQKGGPTAAIQSAADYNEQAGLEGHGQATPVAAGEGVTLSQTELPGRRVITESVGGQVIGGYIQPTGVTMSQPGQGQAGQGQGQGQDRDTTITIGEALEASAMTAGDKPVEQSDAAVISPSDWRNVITPGGLAAQAQSESMTDERMMQDEGKTKLGDVLSDATSKLPAYKEVTRQNAERFLGAELRNNPNLTTHPVGSLPP